MGRLGSHTMNAKNKACGLETLESVALIPFLPCFPMFSLIV